MPIRGVTHWELNVLCIPELEKKKVSSTKLVVGPAEVRCWLACVTATIGSKTGEATRGPYYYRFTDMLWNHEGDAGADARFLQSEESLPPELRFFCFLKTEANFGVRLRWASVQTALVHAVRRGYLAAERHEQYNRVMEDKVRVELYADGVGGDLADKAAELQKVRELCDQLVLPPRSVMAVLSDIGVFQVSSVWADFVDA